MSRYALSLLKSKLLMRSDHCQSHHAGSKLLQELNENNLAVRRPRTDCRGPNLLWAASGLLIILQTNEFGEFHKTLQVEGILLLYLLES